MALLYRKKPVAVEAMQVPFNNGVESLESWGSLIIWFNSHGIVDFNGNVVIETIEGSMMARPGDYIIKGVRGEFYPCRLDIFLETYELVEP